MGWDNITAHDRTGQDRTGHSPLPAGRESPLLDLSRGVGDGHSEDAERREEAHLTALHCRMTMQCLLLFWAGMIWDGMASVLKRNRN